ncbi:DUF2793 domain-containing protein [Allopontixanthobacter sp.]|uniref:DUF2793 domain-containing protein n=1 Tax=Allopontixanthobacter sp. TaxID=2906452 RepID=UPI002ABC968E|nr:DUF2793 domain-containing protein [Allopontixanthobacter sp.]MDZ4308367.1 DUF2793 domain-containing protein [Allopontixanthobacter sp.]
MADPISFTSATPRYGIPFLFAGQAQKEFFVNEAHALIDLLLHPAIQNESDAPPENREEGQCWLVGSNPTGEWSGHEGKLAGWISGSWIFVAPQDGVRLVDLSSNQFIFFSNGWQRADTPAIPSGGQIVDAEAREAIGHLIQSLRSAGILSAS